MQNEIQKGGLSNKKVVKKLYGNKEKKKIAANTIAAIFFISKILHWQFLRLSRKFSLQI